MSKHCCIGHKINDIKEAGPISCDDAIYFPADTCPWCAVTLLEAELEFAYKRAKVLADICGIPVHESPEVTGTILGLVRGHVERLQADVKHWKANHACEVARAKVLKDRIDMPLDRVAAYDQIVELEQDLADEKARNLSNRKCIAELEAICNAYAATRQDHYRMVRTLDVIWNGEEGAAPQASLCDVVSQIKKELPQLRADCKAMARGLGFHASVKGCNCTVCHIAAKYK